MSDEKYENVKRVMLMVGGLILLLSVLAMCSAMAFAAWGWAVRP